MFSGQCSVVSNQWRGAGWLCSDHFIIYHHLILTSLHPSSIIHHPYHLHSTTSPIMLTKFTRYYNQSPHHHIISSPHHYIILSMPSSHLLIIESSNHRITTSPYHLILSSSHHHIIESSITTSSHRHINLRSL